MKQIIILFLISSLFLSSISHIQSSPSDGSSSSSKGEREDDGADDPMDPAAPKSAPFAMSDADGDDQVLTPATLLTIPESEFAVELPPLSPISDLYDPFSPEPAPGPGSDNPNVVKTCQATDNPDLCAESLKPFVRKQPEKAGDSFSLLEMEITATHEATQRALSASINPKNPDMDALKHCKDVYVDALNNLKSSLEAIPARDFGTLKTRLSAAMTDLDTCDQGFEESKKESPMANYGVKLNKMVSNCLAMVASIEGKKDVAEGPEMVEAAAAEGPEMAGAPAAEGPKMAEVAAAEGPEAKDDGAEAE